VTWLLDTTTLSFLMRGDEEVRAHLTTHPRTSVYVCQPVIAEIEYGLVRLPRSARKARLRHRFDIFLKELLRADWTDEVSRQFGRVRTDLEKRGIRLEDFDVAIAAHAMALDAVLVTDNVAHLERVTGLALENWRR
jgi:tRNA(fMet)-specific endonuclease VapC